MPNTLRGRFETKPDSDMAMLADEEILQIYQVSRREDCFAEMVRRYQHSAFRIAFARCGREDLAEDAVQEAFFQLSALKARPEGGLPAPFRFWFFGIVSNVAANQFRAEHRTSRRARSTRYLEEAKHMQQRREDVAQDLDAETCGALARALGSLDEHERMPIVLHFMEGLTQTQVGELVGVTQSVVARRIASGLDALRVRLTQTGVTAGALVLPQLLQRSDLLLASESLQKALASTALLKSTISGSLAAHLSCSARQSVRRGMLRTRLALGAVAACTCAFVGLLTLYGRTVPSPEAKAQAPAAPNIPSSHPSDIATQAHVRKTWDFRTGPLDELRLFQGEWRWQSSESGPAGMKIDSTHDAGFVLPVTLPRKPTRVRITQKIGPKQVSTSGCYWTDSHRVPARTDFGGQATGQTENAMNFDFYVLGRFILGIYEGRVVSVNEYAREYPEEQLCVTVKNMTLLSVEVRTITLEEVPKALRKPENLVLKIASPGARHPEWTIP